jgi:aminotransferase
MTGSVPGGAGPRDRRIQEGQRVSTQTTATDSGRWLADRAKPLSGTSLQVKPAKTFIHLSQGTPDLPTPRHAIEAVHKYLEDGTVYYTFHDGMLELREAIAEKLKRENNLDYDPATEIIVTAGAQEAMFTSMFGTLNPGDEVIVADPRYPNYDEVIQLVGGKIVSVPTVVEDGFAYDPEGIEAAVNERTKGILIISPDHPTGSVQTRETLEAIGDIAKRHDLLIYSDELYERFIFDGKEHVSTASLPGLKERTITINGFSKGYSMTGWRVGYMCVPAAMKPALTAIKHDTSICASAISQVAALAVLTGPEDPLKEMMSEWSDRRDYCYDRLHAIGFTTYRTPGAYFIMFDIRDSGMTSREFCTKFAEEESVRIAPGSGFGQVGEGMARASFMSPMPDLEEGFKRLERFRNKVTKA